MSIKQSRDIDELVRCAVRWREQDPDPDTRAELDRLIDDSAGNDAVATELASRFQGPLTFGTAGLRGEVGAGESRMNVAVVIRATAGLGQYLLETVGPDARVILGRDARHGSAEFLDAAAEVLAGLGLSVSVLPGYGPTPLLAFAIRALDCDAGVMITASHNPAGDNGYKVYLGGRASDEDGRGVQIVPPADAGIAERIAEAPPANRIRRSDNTIHRLDDTIEKAYIERAAGLRPAGLDRPSPVRIVLTPLHGVGGTLASTVLRQAGVVDVHLVPEQFEPDPDFPTVDFPNPEEDGALDHALGLARGVDADVVIALDPDADRCAVAVPAADGWRQLSGDELGWLLGEQAARDSERGGSTLACSVVSSRMLRRIAEHHGLRFAATLTGFKWIARTPDLRFGYEEAIGYCTDPAAVRDKDGITTMVRVVTLVEELAQQDRALLDLLDELARLHGLHATAPFTVRVDDVARISAMMNGLRGTPIESLAGTPVVEVIDLSAGADDLPPTDAIIIRTASDDRVVIRPSGTEPKLKCYVEVILDCDDGDIPRTAAADRLAQIHSDLAVLLDVPS